MKQVAIIGGGLAGTACAYVLKQAGAKPIIYEASLALASGASGNPIGLYNPRFSAERTAESDYFNTGFAQALHSFPALCHPEELATRDPLAVREIPPLCVRNDRGGNEDIDWGKCGSLHLVTDEKRAKRFPQTLKNWRWDPDHMKLLSAKQASEVAGVQVDYDALYLPDAGYVSPHKLCHAYAWDIEIQTGISIESLGDIQADAVILACGKGILEFEETSFLPIRTVRGQLTQVKATPETEALQCNLCYGGYFSPARDGVHTLGATFQRWLDHSQLMEEDDQDNLERLAAVIPGLAEGLEVVGQRAAVRTASKDHFPMVGSVPGHENLYVTAAHGSHGIISTLAAAHLLTDMILDRPRSQSKASMRALSPERFL